MLTGQPARDLLASQPGVAVDPAGRFAIVPDGAHDSLIVLRRDGTSALPGGCFVKHRHVAQRAGAAPVQVVLHPSLAVAYACNGGLSTVTAHHWDSATGHLAFAQTLRSVPTGFTGANTPVGIAISTDGRFLYVVNRGHDSIATFAIQRGKGKMFLRARTMLPAPPAGQPALDATGTTMTVPGAIPMRFSVQPLNGTLSPMC